MADKKTYDLSRTWFFGAYRRAGGKDLLGAMYEFIYLILWSVLPFALGGLVLYVTSDIPDKSYWSSVQSTFRNGELLVFTISLIAPTLYLALHDPDGAEAFPHKLPLSTVGALIIVFCAALFSLQKAGTVKDAAFVFGTSAVLTIFAFLLRYTAMVYHRLRLPAPTERDLRADQEEFLSNFQQHVRETQ